MKPVDSNGFDLFLTQQSVMAGTWQAWDEKARREQVRILVREAHKTQYEPEPLIRYIDND